MIVYKATSPSGKIYIGITSSTLNQRISEHSKDAKRGIKRPFLNAVRKYMISNIKFIVIDKADSWNELCLKEQFWIKFYKSKNRKFGYNCTLGGEGALGRIASDKTRLKMSKSTKEYFKNNQVTLSEEAKKKISENSYNQFSNPNNRVKHSVAHGGSFFLVYKMNNNEYIGEWISRTECAKELNLDAGHIGQCLSGNRKSHKGYIFINKEIE